MAVTGGLAIHLFEVIGLHGVALMMSEKVDLFDPRSLAMATAAVVGILLKVLFLVFPPSGEATKAATSE